MAKLDELLEKDIELESEPEKEYKTQPHKITWNGILDLIMAHYSCAEKEWDRQLIGFVNAIPDEEIKEYFKRQITFFGDQEKLLFYEWGHRL